jgi:hypothetical protein
VFVSQTDTEVVPHVSGGARAGAGGRQRPLEQGRGGRQIPHERRQALPACLRALPLDPPNPTQSNPDHPPTSHQLCEYLWKKKGGKVTLPELVSRAGTAPPEPPPFPPGSLCRLPHASWSRGRAACLMSPTSLARLMPLRLSRPSPTPLPQVMEVCSMLEGAYALLIKSARYPNELVACKQVGRGIGPGTPGRGGAEASCAWQAPAGTHGPPPHPQRAPPWCTASSAARRAARPPPTAAPLRSAATRAAATRACP